MVLHSILVVLSVIPIKWKLTASQLLVMVMRVLSESDDVLGLGLVATEEESGVTEEDLVSEEGRIDPLLHLPQTYLPVPD